MLFEKNHCYNEIHNHRLKKIHEEFNEIDFSKNTEILSIYKYIVKAPYKYYCKTSYNHYYKLLKRSSIHNKKSLIKVLKENLYQFDISIRNLININNSNINNIILPSDDFSLLNLIDNDIHYNYIKLLESPFYYFLLIPAKLSRINRKKNIDGLDLFNVVEELKNSDFSFIENVYNNIIRNGIAHGKIKYTDIDIIYEDKKGNKEHIRIKEIVKKYDRLLDIVNGFCLAFSIFHYTNPEFINNNNIKIPTSLLINELQEKVNVPGWEILTCLDSLAISNKEQIIVYAKNDNWDYQKVFYYTFQTAFWIERLTKSYDRIFFHIDSKHSLLSWAGFDAKKLRKLRKHNSQNIEDYRDVLENNLVFFNPKLKFPRLVYKIGSLRAILKVITPFYFNEVFSIIAPKNHIIRYTQIHSQNGYLVVNDPCIVIKQEFIDNAIEIIRADYRNIVARTIKVSKKKIKNLRRFQTVKFIRVFVFDKDERIRNLRNSGLNENLIATISFNKSPTIKTIDIIGGVLEKKGKYRIVWNKNWKNFSKINNA